MKERSSFSRHQVNSIVPLICRWEPSRLQDIPFRLCIRFWRISSVALLAVTHRVTPGLGHRWIWIYPPFSLRRPHWSKSSQEWRMRPKP